MAAPGASSSPEVAKPKISRAESLAYVSALLVNLVDQMGPQFTAPVLVTYGQWLGASLTTIATFQTARGLAAMVSNIWMPVMSDKFGRKWIAFLSVVGCATGYFTQGIAYKFIGDNPTDGGPACVVFMTGRFITGFFSGMQPVLQAYITELSSPDKTLITQRLVVMQVASNVGGVFLSPLAGIIAAWGMQVPFMVCAIVGVFAMFFVPVFLKEVDDIKGKPDDSQADGQTADDPQADGQKATSSEGAPPQAPGADSDARDAPLVEPIDVESASFADRQASFQERESERRRGSPFCDIVVALMFVAYACLMVMINSGAMFMMPILFQQPSFGIEGTGEELSENVSRTVGLAGMPLGMCQVVVAIGLFVPVTKRFGEVPTIVVMGVIGTALFPLIGIFADKVWKVTIFNALLGVAFGFLAPALGPVAARYGSTIYPKQMALVQGIPLVGLQLSNAFAQNMMAAVVGDITDPQIRLAYCVIAGFSLAFVIVFAMAASLSASRVRAAVATTGIEEDSETVYAAILKRSPSSVGLPAIAPLPVASPHMRRAMSHSVVKSRRPVQRRSVSAGHFAQSLQPVQPVEGS